MFTFREAGKQVPLVTMLHPSPKLLLHLLFTSGYERLPEGGHKAFGWGRLFDGVFFFFAEGRLLKRS
jgi:hypothetical protein